MGDLGRGEADSSLTLFGQRVTPVAHQLARDFVTLDHFYADGEISVLGHSFTTSGYASPFLEWLGNTHTPGAIVAIRSAPSRARTRRCISGTRSRRRT